MRGFWNSARLQWGLLLQRWQEQASLRMSGWAVLALAVANLIVLCSDWKSAQALECARAALELKKTQALAQQSYWPERALQADDRLAQYRSHLWTAQSASGARADVQAWLDVEVKKAGLQEARVLQRLRGLPNVRMAGAFDDFWDVAQAERYAAFLYTSAYDGLPNVLLEAAAAGLPIVAPNVGGIAELVSDTRGYLLPANAEVSHFVLALQEILGDAEGARRRAAAAQKVVLQRHSWQTFKAEVLAIPGYMPRSAITTIKARCP